MPGLSVRVRLTTGKPYENREVTLKLTVEVSNQGPDAPGGQGQAPQPTFVTRTIESTIRLKDGETNFLAGLAGGLFAVVSGQASPGAFTVALSLSLLAGAVLGGLGSLTGAVYGAIALVLMPSLAFVLGITYVLLFKEIKAKHLG